VLQFVLIVILGYGPSNLNCVVEIVGSNCVVETVI
jgi:hypothetical protein